MIDGILRNLRSKNDLTLRADIQDKPEELQKLVEEYFHCG
jgi:glutamine synthetase